MGNNESQNNNTHTQNQKHNMTFKKYIVDPMVNFNNNAKEKFPAYQKGTDYMAEKGSKAKDFTAEKSMKVNNWFASESVQYYNNWAQELYQTSRAQGGAFAVD